MTYDAATGTVIYRSKMHLGLKRNFQVMRGAEWLALLCKHIPDCDLVRVRGIGRNPDVYVGGCARVAVVADGITANQ
jgi:hypothetical protein